MWFLTGIESTDDYSVDTFYLDTTFSKPLEDLDSLVFTNFKTGETIEIVIDDVMEYNVDGLNEVRQFICDQLGCDKFIGMFGEHLFCMNKYEYSFGEYFDMDKLVKYRGSSSSKYYTSSINDNNLAFVLCNMTTYFIARLLLKHPDAFVFDEDAFYYPLSDFNLAFRYTYTKGKAKFDSALAKYKIACRY